MKSITTLLFAILFINISFAQSKDNIFFDQKTLINKFHTIDELEELKKGELISLYKYRVREILTIIPYLALANQADVSLGDNGIKEDSQNLKVLGLSLIHI